MIVAVSPDSRKFPFPPAIPIVALFLSWIIGRLWPIEANWPTWTQWAGLILFTVPFLFAIWAIITFRRNFTVVDPRGQVTTIVTTPVAGSYLNSPPAGALQIDHGNNATPAEAILTVI